MRGDFFAQLSIRQSLTGTLLKLQGAPHLCLLPNLADCNARLVPKAFGSSQGRAIQIGRYGLPQITSSSSFGAGTVRCASLRLPGIAASQR